MMHLRDTVMRNIDGLCRASQLAALTTPVSVAVRS